MGFCDCGKSKKKAEEQADDAPADDAPADDEFIDDQFDEEPTKKKAEEPKKDWSIHKDTKLSKDEFKDKFIELVTAKGWVDGFSVLGRRSSQCKNDDGSYLDIQLGDSEFLGGCENEFLMREDEFDSMFKLLTAKTDGKVDSDKWALVVKFVSDTETRKVLFEENDQFVRFFSSCNEKALGLESGEEQTAEY